MVSLFVSKSSFFSNIGIEHPILIQNIYPDLVHPILIKNTGCTLFWHKYLILAFLSWPIRVVTPHATNRDMLLLRKSSLWGVTYPDMSLIKMCFCSPLYGYLTQRPCSTLVFMESRVSYPHRKLIQRSKSCCHIMQFLPSRKKHEYMFVFLNLKKVNSQYVFQVQSWFRVLKHTLQIFLWQICDMNSFLRR